MEGTSGVLPGPFQKLGQSLEKHISCLKLTMILCLSIKKRIGERNKMVNILLMVSHLKERKLLFKL